MVVTSEVSGDLAPMDNRNVAHEVELIEGQRVGRFVLIRDTDGVLHAITAASVAAVCGADGASLLLLPGGGSYGSRNP